MDHLDLPHRLETIGSGKDQRHGISRDVPGLADTLIDGLTIKKFTIAEDCKDDRALASKLPKTRRFKACTKAIKQLTAMLISAPATSR